MKLVGGSVFGVDHRMHACDLSFENGVITEDSNGDVLDVSGCFVLPGLIDTHIHGARGVCFYGSDDDLTPALDWLASRGVTAILPTTGSATIEELEHDLSRLAAYRDDRILGIHAEGPFLNPINKGGMRLNRIHAPSCEMLERMYTASDGRIKILTLAPEMDGADELISLCNSLGIRLSMGHTSADYDTAKRAVDLGVTRVTHTYNAMPGLKHRDPGILGLALDDDRVTCELICDTLHVSPPVMRIAIRAKGAERVTAISDSSSFAGLPDGEYFQSERTIYAKNGLTTLADGTITGSTLCLADGAKNLFDMGFSPAEIAVMTSTNPAAAAGCTDRGKLAPGYRADIVVFNPDFTVRAVFLAGKRVK